MSSSADFKRARRPEQVQERRDSILRVARELLAERRLANISLRDLGARVGLAKSNVLNYFDSREAIYLEILDEEWRAWLLDLQECETEPTPQGAEAATAATLARTLSARPVLCELLGALANVLEHNISEETARRFKAQASANATELREWIRARLPGLELATAHHCAGAVTILAGALWSYQRPAPVIQKLNPEYGGLPANSFNENLETGLRIHLLGATRQDA